LLTDAEVAHASRRYSYFLNIWFYVRVTLFKREVLKHKSAQPLPNNLIDNFC
jgi:hypothetical protein